jgi:hypothetical protein
MPVGVDGRGLEPGRVISMGGGVAKRVGLGGDVVGLVIGEALRQGLGAPGQIKIIRGNDYWRKAL